MAASQRGKKTSSKEPLSVPERVRKHFRSLVAQINEGHLKNGIKTCDKILRLVPNDPDALETKLAILLHTEQYSSALTLAESLTSDSGHASFSLDFGKAYALYRLNREPEASDVVKQMQPDGDHEKRGVMHMEAQIEYRRGNYQTAQDLYSNIFDTSPAQSDEQSDSLTNLTASQTHLDFLQAGFLRALHSLPTSITASLEDAPPPPLPSLHPVLATATTPQRPAAPQKAVRMSRVPKGVVPGVTPPPDPERWLKKSERTNVHHHGGKRRKGPSGGATQGTLMEGGSKSSGKGRKRK